VSGRVEQHLLAQAHEVLFAAGSLGELGATLVERAVELVANGLELPE
jgi:hypothetical protein